jgi:hypothetical protein
MERLCSLMLTLLMMTPMVGDCCLPVAHGAPCHAASWHSDTITCSVVAETKATATADPAIDPQREIIGKVIPLGLSLNEYTAEDMNIGTPSIVIYLRSHALLI